MVLALPTRTALLGLAAIGATASLLLTGAEAFVIKAFCSWCLVQAGASLVLLVAAAVVARIDQPPTADGNSNHARQRARRALDEARHSLSRTARLGTGAASRAVGLLLIMGSCAVARLAAWGRCLDIHARRATRAWGQVPSRSLSSPTFSAPAAQPWRRSWLTSPPRTG